FYNPDPAAIVEAHGDRLDHIGLAGEELDLETFRHRHHLSGFFGRQAGVFVNVARGGTGGALGKVRLLRVKAEVVEVDMAPVARVLIDQANVNLLGHVRFQIDDDAAQVFFL